MNFKTLPRDAKLNSKWNQNGVALTELTIAVPLFFTVAFGALEISRQFHTSLANQTRELNAALSAQQVPDCLRRSSLWPGSRTSEHPSLRWSESTPKNVFYQIFRTWLGHKPQVASQSTLIPTSILDEDELLMKLDQARNQALSLQRAACLVESSGRLGPQSSLAMLVAIDALPSENARRNSILIFCPVTARIGEVARQSVAMRGVSLHLFSLNLDRSVTKPCN